MERSICDIVGNFRCPPQSFGTPIVISVPGELFPLPPARYAPKLYSSVCDIKICGWVYCRK